MPWHWVSAVCLLKLEGGGANPEALILGSSQRGSVSDLVYSPVVLSMTPGGHAAGPTEPAKVGQWRPEAVCSPEFVGWAFGSLDSTG